MCPEENLHQAEVIRICAVLIVPPPHLIIVFLQTILNVLFA